MKILPLRRLLVVFVAIIGVLFAQLALAAYACPGQTSAMVVQAMPDCAGMDLAQPGLCHASQHDGHQVPDKPGTPHAPLFIPAALVRQLVPATLPVPRRIPPGFLLARTTAPPNTILHCRFQL
ncbi:hypothetical protein IMCC9480_1708 [Oxalobacteraceae bacterium IMCC9480]|nr:hypothetical protein IMCC9480_1708 [Oxalobacteraceae bacterium IMCC9480]NDP59841.1 hypothetical protein [Oxalobacteraceae bacterium]